MKSVQIILLFFCTTHFCYSQNGNLPEGFVYVHEVVPDAELDIRYAGTNNFIGKPIEGYGNAVAILSSPAADALNNVQKELKKKGYALKIFDAYRPQRAVNHFIKWAKKREDTLRKQDFYPEVDKKDLFDLGYIASKSGHSRGSTIDLTIVDNQTKEELDMGSSYDYFSIASHHDSSQITEEQKANRELLKTTMQKHGFIPYPEEWWHYTLGNEPYSETYFDFPVK